MELEEAIEILENEIANICDEELSKALYIVLDNSIKKKIKDKIKELNNKPIKIYASNKKYYYETDQYNKIIKQILQELLEEE